MQTTSLWIFTVLVTFIFMEFMAWFSHKYIMHGFLWSLHKDHHIKDHKSWFERNDLFFIFYALISSGVCCIMGEILIFGLAFQLLWAYLYMDLLILLFTISLFIKGLSCLRMLIIVILRVYEGHIKYIIKTSTKTKVNVLECCGFHLNILNNYFFNQLFLKSHRRLSLLTLT